MVFVKVQKDKAYFKRFQVKYRRRREGKTDYFARKKLIVQAKNKYNTPKYRLVVRFTNKYVICQVVMSELSGDRCIAAANSKELTRYGVKAGYKNYPAAYATGLLCGRRVLDSMTVKVGGEAKKLSEIYAGNTVSEEEGAEIVTTEDDGRTFFVDEVNDDARPFRCYLDVGLRRTTMGCRIWGALKGAVDAGCDIPHNEKKFPGYDKEGKDYNPEEHREKITGEHIAEFMRNLCDPEWCEENGYDTEDFKLKFSAYVTAEVDGDDVVQMYLDAHAAIRADPAPAQAESAKLRNVSGVEGRDDRDSKWQKGVKLTFDERKAALAVKLEAMEEEDEEESDEEESDEE